MNVIDLGPEQHERYVHFGKFEEGNIKEEKPESSFDIKTATSTQIEEHVREKGLDEEKTSKLIEALKNIQTRIDKNSGGSGI